MGIGERIERIIAISAGFAGIVLLVLIFFYGERWVLTSSNIPKQEKVSNVFLEHFLPRLIQEARIAAQDSNNIHVINFYAGKRRYSIPVSCFFEVNRNYGIEMKYLFDKILRARIKRDTTELKKFAKEIQDYIEFYAGSDDRIEIILNSFAEDWKIAWGRGYHPLIK